MIHLDSAVAPADDELFKRLAHHIDGIARAVDDHPRAFTGDELRQIGHLILAELDRLFMEAEVLADIGRSEAGVPS